MMRDRRGFASLSLRDERSSNALITLVFPEIEISTYHKNYHSLFSHRRLSYGGYAIVITPAFLAPVKSG